MYITEFLSAHNFTNFYAEKEIFLHINLIVLMQKEPQ